MKNIKKTKDQGPKKDPDLIPGTNSDLEIIHKWVSEVVVRDVREDVNETKELPKTNLEGMHPTYGDVYFNREDLNRESFFDDLESEMIENQNNKAPETTVSYQGEDLNASKTVIHENDKSFVQHWQEVAIAKLKEANAAKRSTKGVSASAYSASTPSKKDYDFDEVEFLTEEALDEWLSRKVWESSEGYTRRIKDFVRKTRSQQQQSKAEADIDTDEEAILNVVELASEYAELECKEKIKDFTIETHVKDYEISFKIHLERIRSFKRNKNG